ncbi:MAG: hypothetical protein PHU23_13450 [Dehalococcoidales bacterium]|nr:hypothetical protein [Dehalococcoidales bacterium]
MIKDTKINSYYGYGKARAGSPTACASGSDDRGGRQSEASQVGRSFQGKRGG